ncbi:Thermostable beta-glucosidase B [Agrobacterium sp. DSM 25558]|uniref:beta-glucosidase family protein n=1 Tax=Agrobacterium sp. DSM 25558 TaxID=1907665 RepID=UPI00097247C8|nr:glycoside hydrolase family 3 C-terminal domain-containing protein [Agrobacterium sp. DSM 25558]SCX23095.1 Thermostable beta-glucosidase B [Agrobacterium sp. DSM 25558]
MWNESDDKLHALVGQMTAEEKVATLSGSGLWRTSANYRLNIPQVLMTDGTYGVRYSIEQIEGENDERRNLEQFLAVVNQKADRDVEGEFGTTRPATCFPNGSAFACSWDVDLAYSLGSALAAECQTFGVNLLLGPGINIRRTPLAGRSYEYYAEDPVISGDIAAAVIRGLQDNGVGASLKHFACNNSEVQRTTMSSDVDERALREIYLSGFERAIRKGDPWTVMTSYNRVNGVHASENEWLLSTVLREEWGYRGLVMSDWNGIKDSVAALLAGNDLDMPERAARKRQILRGIEAGRLPLDVTDRACLRVLELVRRLKAGENRTVSADFEHHHALARQMAAESAVLLKNADGLLPMVDVKRIAIIGDAAIQPVIQGSGCATTRPFFIDAPLDAIRRRAGDSVDVSFHAFDGASGESAAAQHQSAVQGAEQADVVIVFANTSYGYDGEGSDRRDLHLDLGQDALIAAVAKANPRTIVVLASPDAVEMPWIGEVSAVLATFFGGQGVGQAVADILFGDHNPSGKLTVTFPKRLSDTPGYLHYPGDNNHHHYGEGIYVGYRYYDKRDIEPLFPFGFGLSYTQFAYSDLTIDQDTVSDGECVRLAFDLTNTGSRFGKEICQVYIRPESGRAPRALRELKAFGKVALEPGESRRVEFEIDASDLRYYDTAQRAWVLDSGMIHFDVGASSRDIRLSHGIRIEPTYRSLHFTMDTQPYLFLADPVAHQKLVSFFLDRLSLDRETADKLLTFCETSFHGIYNSISWFAGDAISETALQEVLEDINTTNGWTRVAKPRGSMRGQPHN